MHLGFALKSPGWIAAVVGRAVGGDVMLLGFASTTLFDSVELQADSAMLMRTQMMRMIRVLFMTNPLRLVGWITACG